MFKNKKVFSIAGFLLIFSIIITFLLIIIIAVDPDKEIISSHDAQRETDVNTILNSVCQYSANNKGIIPEEITEKEREICATGKNCDNLVDLSFLTEDNSYLVSLPNNPENKSSNGIGYEINRTSSGDISVCTMNSKSEKICATKGECRSE